MLIVESIESMGEKAAEGEEEVEGSGLLRCLRGRGREGQFERDRWNKLS